MGGGDGWVVGIHNSSRNLATESGDYPPSSCVFTRLEEKQLSSECNMA